MLQVTISKKLVTAPSVWEKTMKKSTESTTKILPQKKKAMRKCIHRVWVERNYDESCSPEGKLWAVVVKTKQGPQTDQFCSIWRTQSHDSGHHITLKAAVVNKECDLGHLLFYLQQLKCPGRNWHSAWRPWLIFDDIQELGKGHKHCRSNPQWANYFTRKIYGIGTCWRISRLKSNWADKLC